MSDDLSVVPLVGTVQHLLQKLLVMFQDLRDLIEHLIHQRRVTEWRVLRMLQGLHVALRSKTTVKGSCGLKRERLMMHDENRCVSNTQKTWYYNGVQSDQYHDKYPYKAKTTQC